MEAFIYKLCAVSILCGVVMSLTPEGSARRVTSFACSLALLCCVLSGIKSPDWDSYALETALLREREQQFLEQSGELRDELDRRVIERECRDYVLEQAERLGLPLTDAVVTVEWSTEGVWVPSAAKLWSRGALTGKQKLTTLLETEIGIPAERQEWIEDD